MHRTLSSMFYFIARAPTWKRAASLGLALLLGTIALSPGGVSAADPPANAARQTVQLVVDYGDGVEIHFTGLPWHSGMTAFDALEAAAAHQHGIRFKRRGQGVNVLVTQIGDLENEGGKAASRNWIYRVDGEQADVGAGARELKTGNVVLWKFGVADYNR